MIEHPGLELVGVWVHGADKVGRDAGELAGLEPADRARVEEACRAGGTSIHASGSSPGFISEALPIVLTSIAQRLDKHTIYESKAKRSFTRGSRAWRRRKQPDG